MNAFHLLVISAALAGASGHSNAQFVKGNEAVQTAAGGVKEVETPPPPSNTLAAPCPATNPGCSGGGWKMVETSDGLVECTEFYARAGTCRRSTYGSQKLPRVWVVKVRGQWLQCQHPDLTTKCVSTKALPIDAIQ